MKSSCEPWCGKDYYDNSVPAHEGSIYTVEIGTDKFISYCKKDCKYRILQPQNQQRTRLGLIKCMRK